MGSAGSAVKAQRICDFGLVSVAMIQRFAEIQKFSASPALGGVQPPVLATKQLGDEAYLCRSKFSACLTKEPGSKRCWPWSRRDRK